MKAMQWLIWLQFREVLAMLSVEEIMNNKELIRRAELIDSLYTRKFL